MKNFLMMLTLVGASSISVSAQILPNATFFSNSLAVHSNDASLEVTATQDRGDLLALRRQTKLAGISLASVWGATVLVAAAMDDQTILATMLPVVGPFLSVSAIEGDPDLHFITGGKEALIFSGVAQAGLAVWFISAYRKQKAFTSGIRFSPVFDRNGTGFAVEYRF